MDSTPISLRPISNNFSNILIAFLSIDSSLIPSNSKYSIEPFVDECVCIARLLSITDNRIYFIVSNSAAEYIIPLVCPHQCIEQIYIYSYDGNQCNTLWMTQFPKLRGCWTDFNLLVLAVYDDIQSTISELSMWSNEKLMERFHNQTLIDSSSYFPISLDTTNIKKYSNRNQQIHIVILHCDNDPLFYIDSQHFQLSVFSDIVKCVQNFGIIDTESVFFIVSGEIKSITRYLKEIPMLKQIYAVYLFVPSVDQQKLDETVFSYNKIGRLFDNLQILLDCLTADIRFYLEQPLYIPLVSIFTLQDNTNDKDKLRFTNTQEKFVAFQLYVNTLREAPASICRNQNFCGRCSTIAENESDSEKVIEILKTDTNKIFDCFIDMSFLSVIINTFVQEQFPRNLLDIQQVLMTIDQRFTKVSPTSSPSIVYRVQLLHRQDLKTIQENVKNLVAFHTYMITTKDLLTARTVARQATGRGLSVIIYQIEILAQAYILELDNNRLMFPFGTIFFHSIY